MDKKGTKVGKKPTKRKPKNWKKKADDTWSLILRLRYQQCEICGKSGTRTKSGQRIGGLNAHHLISRGVHLWRHDLRNGLCLCVYHHKWCKTCSPHAGTITAMRGFIEWLQDNKPEQWEWFVRHELEKRTPDKTFEENYNYLQDCLNTDDFPTYDD